MSFLLLKFCEIFCNGQIIRQSLYFQNLDFVKYSAKPRCFKFCMFWNIPQIFQILCVLEHPVGLLILNLHVYPESSYVRFLQVVFMGHSLFFLTDLYQASQFYCTHYSQKYGGP